MMIPTGGSQLEVFMDFLRLSRLTAVARLLTAQCGLWPQGLEKVAAGLHQPQPGSAAVGAAVSLPITARSKLRGQTSRRKLHPLCPFAPVEGFLVAKVSIGKRRRCGDSSHSSGSQVIARQRAGRNKLENGCVTYQAVGLVNVAPITSGLHH